MRGENIVVAYGQLFRISCFEIGVNDKYKWQKSAIIYPISMPKIQSVRLTNTEDATKVTNPLEFISWEGKAVKSVAQWIHS